MGRPQARAANRRDAPRARLEEGTTPRPRLLPRRFDGREARPGPATPPPSSAPHLSPRRARASPGTLAIGEVVALARQLSPFLSRTPRRGPRARGARRSSLRWPAVDDPKTAGTHNASPSPTRADVDDFVTALEKFEKGELFARPSGRAFRLVRGHIRTEAERPSLDAPRQDPGRDPRRAAARGRSPTWPSGWSRGFAHRDDATETCSITSFKLPRRSKLAMRRGRRGRPERRARACGQRPSGP